MIKASPPLDASVPYPQPGTAMLQLKEHLFTGDEVLTRAGWSYHMILTPGDSVAVTQRGLQEGPCTIFFHLGADGSFTRFEAPHGEVPDPP